MPVTKLRPDKPTVRQTAVFERTEPIVIVAYPKLLSIGVKGGDMLPIGYDDILRCARLIDRHTNRRHAPR